MSTDTRVEGATAAREPRRVDGYAPIEDYAALGDGRTVALVALDGRVDWWPLPALDAPPAFAALLDAEHGGHVSVRPTASFTSSRRYLPETNVLETTFATEHGVVEVTDALAVGVAGPLPWAELIRRIKCVSGRVELAWSVRPGMRFGSARPWTRDARGSAVLHLGDQQLGVLAFGLGEAEIRPHDVQGGFTIEQGDEAYLAVVSSDAEPLFLPGRDELERDLSRTIARWQEWTSNVSYSGPWRETVIRSALALKLLLFSPTGAIAAAPTTSLPEQIGGDRNWDYRYMWIRDSSYTLDALLNLHLHEEVQGAVSFLLDTVSRTSPQLHVFYTLNGEVPDQTAELQAPGYRHSQPVRAGNGAATQTQLGTFGDLFDTLWHYVKNGHVLDPPTGRLLAALADRCCDIWRNPDAGLWELPTQRHYTVSKIGCWVALDRAVRLADQGAIATEHAHRWSQEADDIKAWVNDHCWSDTKHSYTFYAGTDDLDASTLLAGQTGFERGDRLAGTVAAVQRELQTGPWVYRYSGMQSQEGAFVACTFWLVNALCHSGRRDAAVDLMNQAVMLANDVGLFSEEQCPAPPAALGNFPQGLSHLALINAATALTDAGVTAQEVSERSSATSG